MLELQRQRLRRQTPNTSDTSSRWIRSFDQKEIEMPELWKV